jgi:hypothetical protein
MSMHEKRILGLQRMNVSAEHAGVNMISTLTLGSDLSLISCCTDEDS